MLLGDTARAPNQGPTIASATLQIAAAPLRQAAAQARVWLKAQAVTRQSPGDGRDELASDPGHQAGHDAPAGEANHITSLLRGQHIRLVLDPATPLKPSAEWRVAGQSLPRVDIPAKVLGEAAFVHDVRLPGMLHGRVVGPPDAGGGPGGVKGRPRRAGEGAVRGVIAS